MWRDIVGLCAHVNLLVDVDTGNDEEDSRSTSSACEKATQAENDSPLIFLSKVLKSGHLNFSPPLEHQIDDLDNFY